ncbi:Hly-III family protein [Leadbetterella byssophila DSM 17132]|uniref:Hly-III family protein n=1 Tax=Leadbetterella byssophila (strain DSM 17132 / JCM 16389 / KACC 11308 / NBRC 106382 / 4M15) TaxID=649349 RepID=E4RTR3_LEAB4|nr:Hly-III family protein [Leadbetterella byssophila DSM 17132]
MISYKQCGVKQELLLNKLERALRIEMANALSHGIGIILILAFSPLLFLKAHSSGIEYLPEAVSLYVFGLLMVFTFSTLYHATQNPVAKGILRVFDHISIFLLIAGTYLPLVLLHAEPLRAKWLLGIQWVVIAAGLVNKIWFTGRFRLLSSFVYIGLGVMVLAMGEQFWSNLPDVSFYLVIGGGLMYLFGVLFYQIRRWQYNHFIWHLFVLAAAILHFLAVYFSF